ncbi:hypothetical protein OCH239_00735 [Roseivivax halodurans JCM 10272]|uniref:N-acetyltransferase domain-containing protein n=1 Tax=Roseivivax halodurans JCM 10272 TaxID=1449350 RepID=X7EL99_9RHOB|nr:GNAT family N-acetyltransferase [Roseivivax halodurans]ETX16712.1 hypothetical protein OCH239_00735 [Roseivivax halodurans JCM 10272]
MDATITTHPAGTSRTLATLRGILARHYRTLGDVSRRLRFLQSADDAQTDKIAGNASPDEVLTLEIDEDVHGVLEIFESGGGHAEIGLSIADDYQGLGYGRLLFERGLAAVRQRGLTTADLFFSSENTGVRRLVVEQNGTIERHGGDCEARILL